MLLTFILVALVTATSGQNLPLGRWEIRSTVVEFSVPGVPGFLQRMAKGRSSAEHKTLTAGQGVEALLAPDPKARCTVEAQTISDGRYSQSLMCPQKQGTPVRIVRAGTYDQAGFVGQASVVGATVKGPLRIVLSQQAVRVQD